MISVMIMEVFGDYYCLVLMMIQMGPGVMYVMCLDSLFTKILMPLANGHSPGQKFTRPVSLSIGIQYHGEIIFLKKFFFFFFSLFHDVIGDVIALLYVD